MKFFYDEAVGPLGDCKRVRIEFEASEVRFSRFLIPLLQAEAFAGLAVYDAKLGGVSDLSIGSIYHSTKDRVLKEFPHEVLK